MTKMPKAYVTAVKEPTAELCVWSLERLGLEVVLIQDATSLWSKLRRIYNQADGDFFRVDADVIVGKKLLELPTKAWWTQGAHFDLYQMGVGYGVHYIRRPAIPYLRKYIDRFKYAERPETEMYRIKPFYNPRRCVSSELIVGLHGFGQKNLEYVRTVKERRNQSGFDWELAAKLREFYV